MQDASPSISTPGHGHPAAAPALEITGLQFRYRPQGELIVHVPSLTLAQGEQLLLTGGSGTGKSTLLSLIAGLMEPTSAGGAGA